MNNDARLTPRASSFGLGVRGTAGVTASLAAMRIGLLVASAVRVRTVVGLSTCSHRTTLDDIRQVFDALAELGRRLDGGHTTTYAVSRVRALDRLGMAGVA